MLSAVILVGGWETFLAPGPVHRVHDNVAADCDSCHMTFQGVPDARCHSCHIPIAARTLKGEGFHASVANQDCIACHTEHHGLSAALTKDDARRAFNHDTTGFSLRGSHSRADCADCHKASLDTMEADCSGCHVDADVHDSALGPDCGACHQPKGWEHQVKSLADHQLDTTAGHAGLSCEDCHLQGENLDRATSCADCHKQGHGGTDANCDQCHEVTGFTPATFDHGPCTCAFPGKHQSNDCLSCHDDFKFTDTPTLCSGCHSSERTHEPLGECSRCHTALSWSENRFDHNRRARFAIDGSHLSVSCTQCHPRAGVFRGAETSCEGCHGFLGVDAHGDFGDCADCHATAGWSPSSFDHAEIGFALEGQHLELPCQECHAEKVEGYLKR